MNRTDDGRLNGARSAEREHVGQSSAAGLGIEAGPVDPLLFIVWFFGLVGCCAGCLVMLWLEWS